MTNLNDEYKQKYEIIWQQDRNLSKKFMKQIMEILDGVSFGLIQDNEGTELDFSGKDLTIPSLSIGVRIRRNEYIKWDEFTQDDKERTKMSCDIYFLGYLNSDETDLESYMVWDGKDFAKNRDNGNIPVSDRRKNKYHSAVSFNCYKNSDIRNLCKVYAIGGNIGGNKHQPKILDLFEEPSDF